MNSLIASRIKEPYKKKRLHKNEQDLYSRDSLRRLIIKRQQSSTSLQREYIYDSQFEGNANDRRNEKRLESVDLNISQCTAQTKLKGLSQLE